MHQIQTTALALFAERGFDQVTIEQVAEAAEVSPSTVYRYFGTKEGLVIHDEYDDRLLAAVEQRLPSGMPMLQAALEALAEISDEHFELDRGPTMHRMRLTMEHPSIQAAGALKVAQLSARTAEQLARARGMAIGQARVVVASLMAAFLTAVVNWYLDEASPEVEPRDFDEYLSDAFVGLASVGAEVRMGDDPGRSDR